MNGKFAKSKIFYVIFNNAISNATIVQHEYGHRLQLNEMGYISYTFNVAIPSVTAWFVDTYSDLPFDYHSSPWEAGADIKGDVAREKFEDPWQPSDGYFNYLIKLF